MINRKIVDHISDINMPYTENSRRYLLSEGIDGKTIFVTGSPMREVLNHAMPGIEKSDVLERLGLEKGKYILVSAHREENIDLEDNFFGKIENGTELFRALADDTIPEIADQNVSRGSLMDDLIASAECFAHL